MSAGSAVAALYPSREEMKKLRQMRGILCMGMSVGEFAPGMRCIYAIKVPIRSDELELYQ